MNRISPQGTSSSLSEALAAFFLLVMFFAVAACGKTEDTAPVQKNVSGGGPDRASDGHGSGYMDMKGWERAKAEMKTNEGIVKAFNGFFDIWSRAYEHRTFLRFRDALAEADRLPGAMDDVEKLVNMMEAVPGYPEISELKECYVKMIPLLRTGAEYLKKSIEAARDGDNAAEKRHEGVYVPKYKEAMAFNRKSFAVMQEIFTRGSRTEYQKHAGEKKHDASTVDAFRATVRKIIAGYDDSIMKQMTAMTAFVAQARWDLASMKADEVYPRLQYSIMEAGRAEPGDLKVLWDARQELVSMLSYRLMGVTRLREYMEKARAGEKQEAEKAKKVYRILENSAVESRMKLKRMGY